MDEYMKRPTFRAAYAERAGIPPEEFEQRLLRRCVPTWKRALAAMLSPVTGDLLALDRDFLKDVADTRSQSEVLVQLQSYRHEWHTNDKRKLRWLGLRLSGRRLLEAAAVMAEK